MKKTLLLVALLLGLVGCDSDSDSDSSDEAAQLEKERQTKEKVQELCSRYNAVVDWEQGHLEYTVEVEDALIRTNGRPVLLFASVEDIVRESDKYTIYCRYGGFNLLQQILGELERYAVVARISSVKKVRFKLEAYAQGYEYEEVDVELKRANVFMAKGICLDLIPVGDYIPSATTKRQNDELANFILSDLGTDIHFVLDCTPEQAKKIMFHSIEDIPAPRNKSEFDMMILQLEGDELEEYYNKYVHLFQ